MYDADNKRRYVVRYTEVAAIVVAFSLLLVVLFPKNFIYKQVLEEKSNYDLTVAYLRNMLKRDPNNSALLLALIDAALRQGNIDLGLRLSDALRNSPDPTVRRRLLELRYRMLKARYAKLDRTCPEAKGIEQTLRKLYDRIYPQVSKEDTAVWYAEGIWLRAYPQALRLARRYVADHPKATVWWRRIFYLAQKLGDRKLRSEALTKLTALDRAQRKRWVMEAYREAMQAGNYKEAQAWLARLDANDPKVWELRAQTAIATKDFDEAGRWYAVLYEHTHAARWFKLAAQMQRDAGRYDEAIAFVRRYESRFVDDAAMRRWIVRFYLAADRPDEAARFSETILKAVR